VSSRPHLFSLFGKRKVLKTSFPNSFDFEIPTSRLQRFASSTALVWASFQLLNDFMFSFGLVWFGLVCASLFACDGENLSLSESLSTSFLSKSQLFSFSLILQVFHGQYLFARPRIWHVLRGQIREGMGDMWAGYIWDISGIYLGGL